MIFKIQLKDRNSYVCCGINSKPTKYEKDNIWLCLSGKYAKDFGLEMTVYEALAISCALTHGVSEVSYKELLKEVKEKVAKKKKGRMVDLRKAKKGTKKKSKKGKGKKSKKRR